MNKREGSMAAFAAGGSAGAIAGPAVSAVLVKTTGVEGLLLLSSAMLEKDVLKKIIRFRFCLARPCTQHRARCPRNAGTRLPARRCHHGKRGPSILRQSRAKGSLFICTAASSHTKRREIDMWRRQ